MQYRKLGRTGIDASVVAFGGIMLNGTTAELSGQLVTKAIDAGINYFDVAPGYGNAQYMMGPALEPFRKDVFLACKTLKRSAAEAEAELNESLSALKTEYFDVYQMHAIDEPSELEQVFAPGGAMEAIVKAKQQGKIRNIGFTCHRERSALYLMNQYDFDTVLHPINFVCMEKNGKGQLVIKLAQKKNMGIIAIKTLALRPYKEGETSRYENNWYLPVEDNELCALAMRYTANTGNVIMVTPGIPAYLDLMIQIVRENEELKPLTQNEMNIVLDKIKGTEALFSD